MSEFDKGLSDRNVANAQRLMALFGHDMAAFRAMVSPALRMELPFAATVRLPDVLEGEDAHAMFRTAAETFEVRFHSVEVTPLADPNRVLVEYRGRGGPGGAVYDQRYVGVHEYRDDTLVFYREYFDTGVVIQALAAYLPPA